jgi:capsular polysaccharide biosynthesis protein
VWPAAAVVLMGFAAAVTVGTGAAFAADYMDPALRTPEEVMACLDLPVLASLPVEISRRLSA